MFELGNHIKVKNGVIVDNTDIGGWEGRIESLPNSQTEYYLISWDSITMSNLPEEYIIQTLRGTDIDDFHHFYLNEDDFELSTQRDSIQDVKAKLSTDSKLIINTVLCKN